MRVNGKLTKSTVWENMFFQMDELKDNFGVILGITRVNVNEKSCRYC